MMSGKAYIPSSNSLLNKFRYFIGRLGRNIFFCRNLVFLQLDTKIRRIQNLENENMNIATIRLLSQQLQKPAFSEPKDLVAWMGAIQAQEPTMAKWAVGVRLKAGTLQKVERALEKGEILRTHVMRPTWHMVAAEDIRWMLKLSSRRILQAVDSYSKGRGLEMTESFYAQSNRLLEKILMGNKSLTRQEIAAEFNRVGVCADDHRINYFLTRAELEGIVCSGVEKAGKFTYALLEERAPLVAELTKDESLARLAKNYFRSHSPASLQDFIWWSGLSTTEARQAIYLIEPELITETAEGQDFYIHESCNLKGRMAESVHLLPSYDEYLISYKKRTDVLPLEHHPKAFNNFGTFYPVILYKGKVIGNWKKAIVKNQPQINISFFEADLCPDEVLLQKAKEQYFHFLGKTQTLSMR